MFFWLLSPDPAIINVFLRNLTGFSGFSQARLYEEKGF
jgi:hypothetical protein